MPRNPSEDTSPESIAELKARLAAAEEALRAMREGGAAAASRVGLEGEAESMARFPRENPDPIMRLAQGRVLVFANPGAEDLLKTWGCAVGQAAPPEVAEAGSAALAAGLQREIEATYGARTYLFSIVPIPCANYVNVYGHEITERKRAEEALRQRAEELEKVMSVAPAAIWVSHDRECRKIVGNTMANRMYEAGEGENVSAGPPPGEPVPPRRFFRRGHELRPEELPMQVAAAQGVDVKGDELDVLLPSGAYLNMYGYASPLRDLDGQVRGCVGAFLEVTEHKRAEDAARRSETQYRALFEHMSEGLAYCRMICENGEWCDFVYLAVNSTFETLTGLKDVTGKRVSEVIPGIQKTDPELFKTYARVALTGKPEKFEVFVDALKMWFSISAYSPEKEHFVAVFEVITERKQAEKALRASEERFRVLSEAMPQIVWNANATGEVDYFNPQAFRYAGVGIEDVSGLSWKSMIHPEDWALTETGWREALASGQADEIEHRLRRADGEYRWHLTRAVPLRNEKGEAIRWIGTATDIHEQKAAEQELERRVGERTAELAESKKRLETVTSSAPVILFATDARGVFTVYTGKSVTAAGRREGELLGRNIRDLLPERAESVRLIQRALAGESFTAEVLAPSGNIFETRYNPLLDADGNVAGMIGLSVDVTERKRAEEELRRASAYNRSLIEASLDPLVTISADGKITDVNQATERVTGRSRQELIGTDFSDYFTEPDKARAGYQQVFRDGRVRDYELAIQHREGSVRNVLYNASVYRDENGEVAGVFAAARDITDRKQSEKAVQHANAELRRLNRALHTLISCNEIIVRAQDESELLRGVCRILVEAGDYRFAWVGYPKLDEARSVKPVAHAGIEEGYLEAVKVTWADDPWGRGPTGAALRTGQVAINRDTQTDIAVAPWREEQLKRGYACSIALPLRTAAGTLGALTIYAAEPDAFDDQEVRLLSDLAADLAHGIDALRTREDRQRTAAALQQSERRYKNFVQSSLDGVWRLDLDPPLPIGLPEDEAVEWFLQHAFMAECNAAYARMLGYAQPAQLIGKRLAEMIPTGDEGRMENIRASVRGRFQARTLELQALDRTGQAKYLARTEVPIIENGMLVRVWGTTHDHTDLRRAQQAIAAERQRLNDVLEMLPVYVILLTPDYHVSFANRYFRERFGESGGKRCYEYLFGRTEPCEICESYTVLKTGAAHHWEWTGPDGRNYDIADFLFTDTDGSQLILEVGIDITERKRAEAGLRQLSAQLLHTQDEERRRISRELHDSVGQELAAVGMNLGWIKRSSARLNRQAKQAVDESSDLIQRCAQEIRDFSYLLHPPMLDDYGLVSALRWFATGFARRTGIQVSLDAPENLPRRPLAVETALFRVVQECLTNVHRHSGSPTVNVRVMEEQDHLCVEVSDQGRGVQALDAHSRPGIGLAGMRERMRELSGTLGIESGAGGTTVRAVLPVAEQKAA